MNLTFMKNPYARLARLDKPIGSILLGLPCFWGVALCYTHQILFQALLWSFLFSLGAIMLRSAGCIINDIFDVKFDKHVERTRSRPLASGELTKRQAFLALSVLLLMGAGIFYLLNQTAQMIAFVGFIIAVIYPLTKRFFLFPQLILGFAFNIGVLIAVAQLDQARLLTPGPWILYAAGIFWTLYYDTVYAIQDMKDDLKLGLNSTAVFFQNHLKLMLSICYASVIIMLLCLGYSLKVGFYYYFFTILICIDAYKTLKKMDVTQTKRGGFYFIKSATLGLEVLINVLLFT